MYNKELINMKMELCYFIKMSKYNHRDILIERKLEKNLTKILIIKLHTESCFYFNKYILTIEKYRQPLKVCKNL